MSQAVVSYQTTYLRMKSHVKEKRIGRNSTSSEASLAVGQNRIEDWSIMTGRTILGFVFRCRSQKHLDHVSQSHAGSGGRGAHDWTTEITTNRNASGNILLLRASKQAG